MAKILQFIFKPRFPICSICNKPVEIETATADEHGKAVHEECWLLKMRLEQARRTAQSLDGRKKSLFVISSCF
jgi:hypothetical protein